MGSPISRRLTQSAGSEPFTCADADITNCVITQFASSSFALATCDIALGVITEYRLAPLVLGADDSRDGFVIGDNPLNQPLGNNAVLRDFRASPFENSTLVEGDLYPTVVRTQITLYVESSTNIPTDIEGEEVLLYSPDTNGYMIGVVDTAILDGEGFDDHDRLIFTDSSSIEATGNIGATTQLFWGDDIEITLYFANAYPIVDADTERTFDVLVQVPLGQYNNVGEIILCRQTITQIRQPFDCDDAGVAFCAIDHITGLITCFIAAGTFVSYDYRTIDGFDQSVLDTIDSEGGAIHGQTYIQSAFTNDQQVLLRSGGVALTTGDSYDAIGLLQGRTGGDYATHIGPFVNSGDRVLTITDQDNFAYSTVVVNVGNNVGSIVTTTFSDSDGVLGNPVSIYRSTTNTDLETAVMFATRYSQVPVPTDRTFDVLITVPPGYPNSGDTIRCEQTVTQPAIVDLTCELANVRSCVISSFNRPDCTVTGGEEQTHSVYNTPPETDRGTANRVINGITVNAYALNNPIVGILLAFDLNTSSYNVNDIVTLTFETFRMVKPLEAGGGLPNNNLQVSTSFHVTLTQAEFDELVQLEDTFTTFTIEGIGTETFWFRNSSFNVYRGTDGSTGSFTPVTTPTTKEIHSFITVDTGFANSGEIIQCRGSVVQPIT